jgi:hypothetical protein
LRAAPEFPREPRRSSGVPVPAVAF